MTTETRDTAAFVRDRNSLTNANVAMQTIDLKNQ